MIVGALNFKKALCLYLSLNKREKKFFGRLERWIKFFEKALRTIKENKHKCDTEISKLVW